MRGVNRLALLGALNMKRAAFFPVPLAVALTARAQTPANSSDSPYTVVDSGPFWRTWGRTTRQTNAVTGTVTEQAVAQYTELGCGMHYWSNGQWLPPSRSSRSRPVEPRPCRASTRSGSAPT